MPLMMVWADSSSRCTRKVGSSLVKRLSALEKLACAAALLRRDRERDDGGRHVHRGHRDVDRAVGERVARGALDAEERDDVAGARPRRCRSSRWSACGRCAGPCTFFWFDWLKMKSPLVIRALVDAHVRQLAVAAVLELEREADERLGRVGLEDDLRLVVLLVVRLVDDLRRVRAGSRATASSSSCTPLFLKAEPHITGVIFSAMVARRMAARSSSVGDRLVGEELLGRARRRRRRRRSMIVVAAPAWPPRRTRRGSSSSRMISPFSPSK